MTEAIAKRISALDWDALATEIDAHGRALTPVVADTEECRSIADLWAREDAFRAHVDMARHGYGEGEYRYFAAPLPPPVAILRECLYARLAPIANRWSRQLRWELRFPPRLETFLGRCARAGQQRPTPLLLRYEAGGFNRLHQDRYGALAFPLQAALFLSEPGRDYEGGEFLLVEQRARSQSRGEALRPRRGQILVFPHSERPIAGKRGPVRVQMRHGVSPLRSGQRQTLGLIFHDAR